MCTYVWTVLDHVCKNVGVEVHMFLRQWGRKCEKGALNVSGQLTENYKLEICEMDRIHTEMLCMKYTMKG